MFGNPVFVTPGRYKKNFERFDVHVFGEKFSESNSMWKRYPDPHNFEDISKQRSILFHFRTLTSGSIFSS